MSNEKGFSLIELIVVTVIVGILATIAFPSYQNFTVRGNRAAAQAFMMDAASREKQYLLDARSYTNDLAILFGTATSSVAVPDKVLSNYGSIAITVSSAPPTFTITATPTSSQQSGDGWLSLSSDGAKNSQYSGKW